MYLLIFLKFMIKNLINIFFFFIYFIPLFITILLSVAFFTLMERKELASMQRRRGPNVVGIYGSLQAIADGFKLLNKETTIPLYSNYLIFMLAPLFTFILSIFCWAFLPININIVLVDINIGLLLFFAFSSLGVYGIIVSGWSSNSKYAFLGALRSSAQFISYEISMGLIIIPIILYAGTANIISIVEAQNDLYYVKPFFHLFILFLVSALAETNRIPFDLPEAESELVSGYNVEYSSIGFTFFFLAEYSNIILMSCIITCIFFGGWVEIFYFKFFYMDGVFWFCIKFLFLMFVFVWIRGTLPRYRYDQLMMLGWKVILPVSFGFVFISIYIYMILL